MMNGRRKIQDRNCTEAGSKKEDGAKFEAVEK
jgi:hypothetical protein